MEDENYHYIDNSQITYKTRKTKHKIINNKYAVGRVLGTGSYGDVKEIVDIHTYKYYALKIMRVSNRSNQDEIELLFRNELNILKLLKHPNVVKYSNNFRIESKNKYYLVIEYMSGGNLENMLKSADGTLPIKQCRSIFKRLVLGLKYIHSMGIVHRDINPKNIMMTVEGEPHISDFGVAFNRNGDEGLVGEGAPAFQAPELIRNIGLTDVDYRENDDIFQIDVWSLGIVLYILLFGKFPFKGMPNIVELFDNISNGEYIIPQTVDKKLANFIASLFRVDPAERITLKGIKKHEWMKVTLDRVKYVEVNPIATAFSKNRKVRQEMIGSLTTSSSDTTGSYESLSNTTSFTSSSSSEESSNSKLGSCDLL
eukprot:TRINITY_DN5147_c0_g1_i1.p1 TRINITY_DN5147_c0_g1~~TRINITY_DN5147_c0_g1_i1.p1  ORF type:complete len:369 (-),score=58.16 TRINITY_DN5147_c0_g1_i1:20-1126(-)